MNVKLLTEYHLEFLTLKEGCTGLSESTLVKMPHCWKSHVVAQLLCHIQFFLTVKTVVRLHSLHRGVRWFRNQNFVYIHEEFAINGI